jgi:hypothetical protein
VTERGQQGVNIAQVRQRFDTLLAALRSGYHLTIEPVKSEDEGGEHWEVEPPVEGSLSAVWSLMAPDLQLETIGGSGLGGRWELVNAGIEDVDFIEDAVWSIAAGRVREVFGPGRSSLEITLSNGSVETETGGTIPLGLLPVPGWRDRGRVQAFRPWPSLSE